MSKWRPEHNKVELPLQKELGQSETLAGLCEDSKHANSGILQFFWVYLRVCEWGSMKKSFPHWYGFGSSVTS